MRRKANSKELTAQRTIHFSRVDLLPFQVDTYDAAGAIETEADSAGYQDFDGVRYPKTYVRKNQQIAELNETEFKP